MVDTQAFERPEKRFDGSARRPWESAGRTEAGVATCLTGRDALAFHRRFCDGALHSPAQSPAWIEAWARHCNEDILCVTWAAGGTARLAICLEVIRSGPIRVARLVGGSHANGNFPALATDGPPLLDQSALTALARALRKARPDVDLLLMERLSERLEGIENPLTAVRSWQSPNPALAVDLSGGFEAVLSRTSGKRKCKKHRSQVRRFEAAGGHRRYVATDRAETERLLDAFFRMKAARFAAMGVADVFAEESVQAFFRALFGQAAGAGEAAGFLLHALEVGGTIRAITGSSRTPSTIICEFGAISSDELGNASPGDFLFFENIREASEDGLAVYDFSVGDEAYKRQWCDLESRHFDVAVPLTLKGRLATGLRHGVAGAKRLVKSNPRLWSIIKKLRRREAPEAPKAKQATE